MVMLGGAGTTKTCIEHVMTYPALGFRGFWFMVHGSWFMVHGSWALRLLFSWVAH